jgi:DNA (cytosine-5)-methyltransferase 1
MRVLDLFSGIGGFALGLESVGMQTVAFCESDGYARRVLRRHWPDVWLYEDVRTLTAKRLKADGITDIDLICGGFPCQDISCAGKGAGIEGSRSGLWSEYARLIREVRPRWVIAENVPALRCRGADKVLGDLEAAGYFAWPLVVGAIHAGAPHQRQRAWIVAHTASQRYDDTHGKRKTKLGSCRNFWAGGEAGAGVRRVADGVPNRVDRLRCLGNAVVPQVVAMIGQAILDAEQAVGREHAPKGQDNPARGIAPSAKVALCG